MKEDYYQTLGISKYASEAEVKKAFRRLAHQFHPDKNPDNKSAEESFKKINEAYEVLKDPKKKAAYDRFGHLGERAYGGFGDTGFSVDFQDIFSDIFGDFLGGRKGGRGQRGADLKYNIEITFEESAFGTEKELKIPKTQRCEKCSGSGARPGTSPTTCTTCNGRGEVHYQQGFFSISRPCHRCSGAGTIIKDPCPECFGSGRVKKYQAVKVRIPAGVSAGSRLKLIGEGEYGIQGGPPGDLYVVINVEEHPLFRRENDDLICEIPISFPQAALGCEIEVPTLDGRVTMGIPPGTQSGKIFTFKGKGFPFLQGYGKGDEHISIRVETPSKLSKRQKELLMEFEKLSKGSNNPISKGFLNKVKGLFE